MSDLELGKKRAEELGLEPTAEAKGFYRADDIHKLLGDGVEVFENQYENQGQFYTKQANPYFRADRTALAIGWREIAKKTREQELEEVVRAALNYGIGCDLTYRAKALLERK